MCTIDKDIVFSFTKNTWIGNSSASCHITNNDTGLFDVIDINKSIKGSSDVMPAMKKFKLWVNVWQDNRTESVHTLFLVKFCPKAGGNLLSLMCELLQRKTIWSNHQNNIVVNSTEGVIILDHWIKTCDGWEARVSSTNQWWESPISYCPLQENCQWPTCWVQTSFQIYWPCPC